MATAQHTETGSTIGNLARSPNLPVMLTIAAMVIGLAALLPLVQNRQIGLSEQSAQRRASRREAHWPLIPRWLKAKSNRTGSSGSRARSRCVTSSAVRQDKSRRRVNPMNRPMRCTCVSRGTTRAR